MAEWRELTDRRQAVGEDRVRLWFDLGAGQLRSAVVKRWLQSAEDVRRVGDALAAEGAHIRPRVYGDG